MYCSPLAAERARAVATLQLTSAGPDAEIGTIASIVKRVRTGFESGRTLSLDWRRRQIEGVLRMVRFPWQEHLRQEAVLFPKKYRHLLSHQRILGSFWEIELSPKNLPELVQWCQKEGFNLVEDQQIDALPKPKLILRYLTDREI